MMQRVRSVVGVALLWATGAACSVEINCPEKGPLAMSVQLDYTITASRSILSIQGDGRVVYRRRDEAYAMESSVQALGLFEAHQSSVGVVGAAGLVPRKFTQRTSRRPQRDVTFDWAANRVLFSENEKSAATRPQMQDRLSLVMQLAWRQRAEPQAREIVLPVAGLKGDADYLFSGGVREAVTVPAGRFEAVKFERERSGGESTLEIWLAPAVCSLPVRLRYSDENGVVIDQQLKGLRRL